MFVCFVKYSLVIHLIYLKQLVLLYMAKTKQCGKDVYLVTSPDSFIKHKHTKHIEITDFKVRQDFILPARFGYKPPNLFLYIFHRQGKEPVLKNFLRP